MSTSLAAQLHQIAAKSTNSLDLKAQRTAHAQSLIFEPKVAATQDFDTIFQLCLEGFQELCLLDPRFAGFGRSIFSEHSKTQERTHMTSGENDALNKALEDFMGLVGARLLLTPAVKAMDWLVRRFRVHEYNIPSLLLTFMPYHTAPIFLTLLSILPANIPLAFKFLHPYIKSLISPPRHTIVYSATNNMEFFAALNAHVVRVSKARVHYRALLSFWAGIATETLACMLDNARSGRHLKQRQSQQDVLLQILPCLNEALAVEKVPDLKIGCYMLITILACKCSLEDNVLMKLMEAVAKSWTADTKKAALVCLSIVAQEREVTKLPKPVFKAIMAIETLEDELLTLQLQFRVDKLTLGLVLGCIHQLGKTQDNRGLSFVKRMLDCSIFSESQAFIAVEAYLRVAQTFDITSSNGTELQSQLADLLARLTDSRVIRDITTKVLETSGVKAEEIEARLQFVMSAPDRPSVEPPKDAGLLEAKPDSMEESFEWAISAIPTRTAYEASFLSHSESYVFPSLSHAFILSTKSASHLKTFTELPVLRKALAVSEPLYFTFFIRIWCGPYPVLARGAALQVVSDYFSSTDHTMTDVQALIPYILVALADSSVKIRRAASELLLQLGRLYKIRADKDGQAIKTWGIEDIYGQGERTSNVRWLSSQEIGMLFERVLLPGLEEFVLDSEHVSRSVASTLGGAQHTSQSRLKGLNADLKTASRVALLSFLCSHIVNTPLYAVKLQLLRFLKPVEKVGSSSQTKELLPLLQSWTSRDHGNLDRVYETEGIQCADIDRAVVAVVLPFDREGIHVLQSIVKGAAETESPNLVLAAAERIRTIWPRMKVDMQLACVDTLLELSLDSCGSPVSHHSQSVGTDTLRVLPLSTPVLVSMLDKLPAAAAIVGEKPRPAKRRRTSNSQVIATDPHDANELASALRQMTLILELVESSQPGRHPQLLRCLFRVLGELQSLKSQVDSELPYLQNLVLGSLLAVVDSFKNGHGVQIDRAAVRVDLLVDCVRATANPQVQQRALLLIADLASVTPELILHSIMPIFTFMGASMLRQDDEYSAFVINRTINEVVPPLVEAMRKQNKDALSGSSELLLSFVAAFEHIPWHRRHSLFESLLRKLGPEEFLFALLALLADKYVVKKEVQDFAVDLTSRFSPKVQLMTIQKYIELIADALRPKRTISELLLSTGTGQGRSVPEVAHRLLKLAPRLLSAKNLISGVSKCLQQNGGEAATLRDTYSSILQQTLGLAQHFHDQKPVSLTCGVILDAVLALLSTTEFIQTTNRLLHGPDLELRRKILKSLDLRIRNDRAKDPTSRDALLKFLPELTAILRDAPDVLLKQAALNCVDQISENFGKKDRTAIAKAAEVVSSEQCLGHADDRLCTLALLCLASMVEVLEQTIIPILPGALPRACEHLRKSLQKNIENEELHNAVYSFLSALLVHVPWIISGGYLDSILKLSFESSNADMGGLCDHNRRKALQLLAKQTNVKDLLVALEKDWTIAVTEGPQAVKESLDILSLAIAKQPKSMIVNNSSTLSSIFMRAFDSRRIQFSPRMEVSYEDEEVQATEMTISDVAIKMIYKMNDATFRPLFISLLEWASTGLPKSDKKGRRLRLTSLFTFLETFFSTLKSIVTSYATHVIELAVEVLENVDLKDMDSVSLSKSVLCALRTAFEHDQDDFWQAPSHFKAISSPLLSQLRHASMISIDSEAIPAITELAAAADSAENHKEMNAAILKQMRSDDAQVRLAAVKCEQSLTARLGEEWLALLPEMLPFISELQEDDDEMVEMETHRWIVQIEGILGESLDSMLQ